MKTLNKVKTSIWINALSAIIIGILFLINPQESFQMITIIAGIIITVLIFVSLLNFFIYLIFSKHRGKYNPKQVKRRHEYKKNIRQARPNTYENGARHKCVVCGRTELTNPELTFRYCSKCSGNKEYCQDHLFTHEHY